VYLHKFCFAPVARYSFENIFSVKLNKTLYCQIFELVLFRFSQVALIVIILEMYPVPNMLIAATISYWTNISNLVSFKVIAMLFVLLFEKARMEESHKTQHGPFSYNFVLAVGHEHYSSSEVGRDRKSLRTTALM